jgi:hypothetical protein
LGDFLKDFNFVVGGFQVVRGAFHDFDSDVVSILEVFGEPDSGEVSPSEFLDKNVSVDEDLTDVTRVIPANFIIFNALIFTMVLFIEVENEFFKSAES